MLWVVSFFLKNNEMVGKTHQICTQRAPAIAFLVDLTVTLYPSFRVIQAPVLKYSNHIPISGPLNLLLCPPKVPFFLFC